MIPSRRALTLLGLISLVVVFGFVTPALGWVGLALDLAVLLAVLWDGWCAAQTQLVFRRELPQTVHQLERHKVTVSIDNPGERPVALRLREVLDPCLTRDVISLEATLSPRSRTRLPYELRPRVRGLAQLETLAVRVAGPLGLAWAGREAVPGQQVRVYPRVHLEGDAGLLVRQALRQRAGANPQERRGLSTELYALRPYHPGDTSRQIHWKASARRGQPVSQEMCWEQHQHVVVLADCGRPMASLADDATKLDHALAAILAMLRVVVAQNDTATIVLFSKELRRVVRVDRRTRGFSTVFEQLYQEQADLDEPGYAEVAAWCYRRVPRRSQVLVCTSVMDALGAERLGQALVRLATRHSPLLVNLEDPGLVAHARSIPDDSEAAYAKASAMAIMARIDALTRQLRASGVDVLSMPASQMAIGMINRYLAFKARGQPPRRLARGRFSG